jgi:predicted nucleic acid-binding protein
MTSSVVVDSGVLLASVLKETYTEQAQQLLTLWDTQNLRLAAPVLLHYELAATVRKRVFRQLLAEESAILLLDTLLTRPIDLISSEALVRRAYELATQYQQPTTYDSQYLALAESLGAEFWTLDERLYNSLKAHLPWMKWVGNFTLSEPSAE